MGDEPDGLRRHFILEGVTKTEPYRYVGEPYRYVGSGGGDAAETTARDRVLHGASLQRQIEELRGVAESAREAQKAAGMENGLGWLVEFESFSDIELAFESLARD